MTPEELERRAYADGDIEHAKLLAMFALGARVLVAGYGEAIVQEHVSTGVHAGTIRVQ